MRNRIYISGKITGTTDYMERFRKAEEYLASRGFSPVNPAKVNAMMPEDTTYEEYMIMRLPCWKPATVSLCLMVGRTQMAQG